MSKYKPEVEVMPALIHLASGDGYMHTAPLPDGPKWAVTIYWSTDDPAPKGWKRGVLYYSSVYGNKKMAEAVARGYRNIVEPRWWKLLLEAAIPTTLENP